MVQTQNVGRYLNHGIDLRLQAEILQARDYNLSAYTNFSYNRDKVLELFGGRSEWFEPGSQLAYIVGEPVTYVLPIFKWINPETGDPEWYEPGESIAQTTRDDSRVVSEYVESLEQNTGIPVHTPITGGWGVQGEWKRFYMNADFSFALGKHTLSMDKNRFENDYYLRDKAGHYNGSRLLFNYWKNPGDQVEFPSLFYTRMPDKQRQSSYVDSKMLENASFMRLKSLIIGYNFPEEWLKRRLGISSAKVYFAGRNLLTFTRYRGIDPEVNTSVALGANPNTKQVSVGIELSF